MNKFCTLLAASALAVVISSTPASALNIVLRPDATFTGANGAAALNAFQKAANYWNQTLTNNATINIAVSFANLGNPNVIGQAGSNGITLSTASVYAALATQGAAANGGTALDAIAVANLRPLSAAGGVGYRMPDSVTGVAGTGTGLGLETVTRGSVYDNDDTYNNRFMSVNTANARALGIAFNDANTFNGDFIDANITFNSVFAFDYDPTNGISNGTQDFTSVALHEIGHALGFVSGTDTYDFYGNPNGPGRTGPFGNTFDWDNGQFIPQFGQFVTPEVLSVWDLFRYSTNPPSNAGFDPATGKRYLQLDPNRGAAFSIDGVTFFNQPNTTGGQLPNLSTGRYNGDLQQASHWKDSNGFFDENGCFVSNQQIGIMDPTSGSCQMGIVTGNDLGAFDAMGYNLNFNILNNRDYAFNTGQVFGLNGIAAVPEPASWAMMIGGMGVVGGTLRRRRQSVRVTFA